MTSKDFPFIKAAACETSSFQVDSVGFQVQLNMNNSNKNSSLYSPFGISWTKNYEWSLGAILPTLESEWRNKLSSDRQRGPRWRWCNKHTRGKACEMEPSMIVRISSCWPNKTLHVFQILMTKHNAQCSIVFGDQSKFWMFCSSI